MHAHNISKETFGKARYLFSKINNELDKAIFRLLEELKNESTTIKLGAEKAIYSAINQMEYDTIEQSTSVIEQLVEALKTIQFLENKYVYNQLITALGKGVAVSSEEISKMLEPLQKELK